MTWWDHYARVGAPSRAFSAGARPCAPSPPGATRSSPSAGARVSSTATCGPTSWSTPRQPRSPGWSDWEFVHAGHPVEDLGSLLREGRRTPFAAAVVDAMTPWLPDSEQASSADLVERARAADLYWLIEAASRRGQGPATDRAFEHLLAMGDSGSLLTEPA